MHLFRIANVYCKPLFSVHTAVSFTSRHQICQYFTWHLAVLTNERYLFSKSKIKPMKTVLLLIAKTVPCPHVARSRLFEKVLHAGKHLIKTNYVSLTLYYKMCVLILFFISCGYNEQEEKIKIEIFKKAETLFCSIRKREEKHNKNFKIQWRN